MNDEKPLVELDGHRLHINILRRRLFIVTVSLSAALFIAGGIAAWSLASAHQAAIDRQIAAQDRAHRHADSVANADAQYQQCVQCVPILNRVNLFVRAVGNVDHILLTNALATHTVTPDTAPNYEQQIRNIARLRAAISELRVPRFTVPTYAQCKQLQNRLEAQE